MASRSLKNIIDILTERRILIMRKFLTGRPSDMGFAVCTINISLVMVSVTRKGRGIC